MEEVNIGPFTVEHALGVHPEIHLVVALENRRVGKKEKIRVQIPSGSQEYHQQESPRRVPEWPVHEDTGCLFTVARLDDGINDYVNPMSV